MIRGAARSRDRARSTQTHSDPKQGPRWGAPDTITFSSLLGSRKNSGATRRLLGPCGKTHGRLSPRSLSPQPNKGPAVEQEVTSGTALLLRQPLFAAWWAVGWGRKVKADTDTTKSLAQESVQCFQIVCVKIWKRASEREEVLKID